MKILSNERLTELRDTIETGQNYVNVNHGVGAEDVFYPYACEGWALRGLDITKVNIQNVFNWINTGVGDNPLAGSAYAELADDLKSAIRLQFGHHPANYTTVAIPQPHPMQVGGNPERQGIVTTRNGLREALHNCTAMVFELCLQANGFTLSDAEHPTDYMVCMEYECAPDQPMYPNFTHGWLMIQNNVIVQKITNSKISITRHEAGRQPHCGIIRRYVTGLEDMQADVIEGILIDLATTNTDVTNCGHTDIRTLALPTDQVTPPAL